MKAKKAFYKECHVAGRKYHDADFVFEQLNVGTKLHLVRDTNNRYDPDAIALLYHTNDGEFIIGYIPSNENEEMARFLDMGWTDLFDCRISRINPLAHYEQQIHITIRINQK